MMGFIGTTAPMALALSEARQAARQGEVPVGAVVVELASSRILAIEGNHNRAAHDPTAHAEIQAIRKSGRAIGNERLVGCAIYVTLEPCAMCAAAISHARLDLLVYAAADPKMGGVQHGPRFFEQPTCHHRPEIRQDATAAAEAREILRDFFRKRRAEVKANRGKG